ncbi:MAG: hypothetical protein WCF67_03565 [Chitinophagaceae bacterium]
MDGYRSRLLFIPLLSFILFSSSCSDKPAEVSKGFYAWRTSDPEHQERKFLKKQGVQKLYKRLLDVDWGGLQGPVPVAETSMYGVNYALHIYDSVDIEIIPVIFITNKTFEKIDSAGILLLAKRLVRRCFPAYDSIDKVYEEQTYEWGDRHPLQIKEIQFDCDWTVKTAPKYFSFLNEVKKLLPSNSIKISATIRLHQYKYVSKTGVPPVDRGMLMMYNISDPKKYSPVNSIFDKKEAAAYFTSNKKYPLPLDITLPAWQWCIIFRNGKFYQVENGLTEDDLRKASFLKPTGNHFYAVTKDTVYRELFLRPGDEIKAEAVDEASLAAAAKLARSAVNSDKFTVSFFELTYKDIQQYSDETFDKLYSSFR